MLCICCFSQLTQVSLQMMSFADNPYSDCGGDENITTSVVALELQQTDGTKVFLQGLKKEIDIRIRQPEHSFDLYKDNFVLQINGTSQFHRFNHSLDDVTVGLEFFSKSDNILEWNLMVAHEKRPQTQYNLASWLAYRNERKLFLLESSLLNKEGTYYVYIQGKANMYLEVNNVSNASYSLKVSTFRCFFWNETTERWSSAGCRVGSRKKYKSFFDNAYHISKFF